jgi:hypothetical protein
VGGVESRSGTTRSGALKTPRTLDRPRPRPPQSRGEVEDDDLPRGKSGRTALKPPSGATLTRAARRPAVSIMRTLAAAGRTLPVTMALGPCVLTTKRPAPRSR